MSLADYTSALPRHFGIHDKQPDKQPEEASTAQKDVPDESHAPTKGFVDIIEYHPEEVFGRNVRIHRADRFIPDKKKKKQALPKFEDYVLVLRRTSQGKNGALQLIRLELEIQSDVLCNALKKAARDLYEGRELKRIPLKLPSPFRELFFYRETIKQWAENETDPALRHDAQHLSQFMQSNSIISSIIEDHDKYINDGQVVHDILWTVYPPNGLVVVTVDSTIECWLCRDVSVDQQGLWTMTGFRIGFDGNAAGLVRRTISIPLTRNSVQKISDLSIVPVQYYRDWAALKRRLEKRASVLQELLGDDLRSFQCQSYSGPSFGDDSDYDLDSGTHDVGKQLDGRVIVDLVTYWQQEHYQDYQDELVELKKSAKRQPIHRLARGFVSGKNVEGTPSDSSRSLHSSTDSSEDESSEGSAIDDADITECKPFHNTPEAFKVQDEDTNTSNSWMNEISKHFGLPEADIQLLFPARVPGYSLKNKNWRWLLSDNLSNVEWNPKAFLSLKLKKLTKDLIEALVKGHKTDSATFDDIVPGKGQGLIFLLHGQPGLGKTLTAESVADYLERPLYSISGGELGTDVQKVEDALDLIFDLTKRWNAVVLLDEADVLLCKRSSAEVERNAIVGVLLRKIEYFQGALFLTTNRKQDFDEAFKSRIHVTISFPELSRDFQAAIWENLITANTEKNLKVDSSWQPDIYDALGGLQLNGRTIKNILRTAVAYANAEDGPLGVRHVLDIVKTELEDDSDMASAQDASEGAKRAQQQAAVRRLEELLGLDH